MFVANGIGYVLSIPTVLQPGLAALMFLATAMAQRNIAATQTGILASPVQAGVEETEIILVVGREGNSRNTERELRKQKMAPVPPEDEWVGEEIRGIARDIPRSNDSVEGRRRGNRARLP